MYFPLSSSSFTTPSPPVSLPYQVHNAHDLSRVMELGSKNRSVGATLMNVDSSRSHSIFTIDIEMAREGSEGGGIRAGRLNLVDLAGSERQSKTGSTGERLKEATKINLSLSALGNVISGEQPHLSGHSEIRTQTGHLVPT